MDIGTQYFVTTVWHKQENAEKRQMQSKLGTGGLTMAGKEYIEREYAIQFLEEHMTDAVGKSKTMVKDVYLMAKNHAKNYLSIIPAADVVEVVRCKECKHGHWNQETCHGKPIYYCDRTDLQVSKCDFCSYGERKENESSGIL